MYRHQSNNPLSLSNNFITTLYEDTLGNLWVGTEHGLNKFNLASGKIYHYIHNANNPNSISGNHISCIVQDKKGNIWTGTRNSGLNVLDPNTGNATHFFSSNSNLPSNAINDLLLDNKGNIWIATMNGLARFNPIDSSFVLFKQKDGNPNWLNHNSVWCITQDDQGFFWIGTSNGINKLFYKNEKFPVFSSYSYLNPDGQQDKMVVTDILVDLDQSVWFGTNGKGLYKLYQDETGAIKHIRFNNVHYMPTSLIDDHIYCITRDFSGNIWLGTKYGVSRFDATKQGFIHLKRNYDSENSLPDNAVWYAYSENNDLFWFGTKKGLTRYDRIKNNFISYHFPSDNPNRPDDEGVYSFIKDSEGDYWAGTTDGLFRVRLNNDHQIYYKEKIIYKDVRPGENDPIIYFLFEDSKKNIWVGSREGLSIYNKKTRKYIFLRHEPDNPESISNNIIRYIHEDPDNYYWVATHNGLNRIQIEGDTINIKRYLSTEKTENLIITTVLQNSNDILWLGTYGDGIIKFNINSGISERFTQKTHGLANDAVY